MHHNSIDQNKAELAVLIYQIKQTSEKRISSTIIRVNPTRRHTNPKCICTTRQQSCEIREAKTDRTERRDRQIQKYSWRLQCPSLES